MIKIKVPATTANVGPGFDAVGIALNIYNCLTVEKRESLQEFVWPNDAVPFPESDNLVLQACRFVLNKHPDKIIGFSIQLDECNIPISRGLGSSAAAIVAGLYAANYLLDNHYDTHDLINFATELEGHPDNVVPAILGGMVISTIEDNEVLHSTVRFPEAIVFNVMVPDFKLSTRLAREVLPTSYSRNECVLNISRVSMLINSLITCDYEKIRPCLKDAIHQPYRLSLINNSLAIMQEAKELNALGEFISGAGPTLIALTLKKDSSFKSKMTQYLASIEDNWALSQVDINTSGTITEVIYE